MARKKNIVKSAPNSLRQALLAVKTAILNFSPEHILFLSYDPSSKAMTVKDIPANLESQFTLGESGGGEALKGKIKVKMVNNSTVPINPSAVYQERFLLYIDGGLYEAPLSSEEIAPNSESYVDYVFFGYRDGDDMIYQVDSDDMKSTGGVTTETITQLVNCSVSNVSEITIIDPTLEASCTVTYIDELG